MKNILIFYTPIIEEIDQFTKIIYSLIRDRKQDKIYVVQCEGKKHLRNCISNYQGHYYKCYLCKHKMKKLIDNFNNLKLLHYNENDYSSELISSVRDLLNLKYKDINIGKGVHSAAMTILKDHSYNLSKNKNLLNSIIHTSKKTIDFLYENKNLTFDEIYVFNGRVSHFNSVVEFSKFFNIDYYTFEIVPDREKFLLIKNAIPHNRDIFYYELIKHWNQSDKNKRDEIGKLFFNKAQINKDLESIEIVDYTSYQNKSNFSSLKIPEGRFISIFGSSRNEYESVEGWENNFLSGDDEEIIIEICRNFKNKNFIYRAHPNLKLLDNQQTKNIKKLKDLNNLIVFDSFSKISTYDLIRISEKVIVFGSTVGVEATFFRKPVICIGPSLYEKLDIAYFPKDLEELRKLIFNNNLLPRSKEDAVKYGFFELTRGSKLSEHLDSFDLKLNILKRIKILVLKVLKILSNLNFNLVVKYLKSISDKRVRKHIYNFFKYN